MKLPNPVEASASIGIAMSVRATERKTLSEKQTIQMMVIPTSKTK